MLYNTYVGEQKESEKIEERHLPLCNDYDDDDGDQIGVSQWANLRIVWGASHRSGGAAEAHNTEPLVSLAIALSWLLFFLMCLEGSLSSSLTFGWTTIALSDSLKNFDLKRHWGTYGYVVLEFEKVEAFVENFE